jgi:type IV pilus assembly protein PilQ
MALWMAVLAPLTSVKGVSVAPVGDRTEIVITVDGQVSVKDFTLDNPTRLVLDIEGARYALPRERFVGIERGGIRSLRASQFRASIVRVVFDLKQPVQYTVQREDGQIRVSFPNPAGAFEPWHAGVVVAAAAEQSNGAAQAVARAGQPNGAARAAAPAAQVAPPATAAPAAAPAPQPVAATREPYAATSGSYGRRAAQQSQQPRITVHFQNSPIVDVLVTFAEFSGRSIVPGANVTGTVTADIRDQPWDVALREILHAHGLGAQETESGIIRVDKLEQVREREKVEELVTRQFPIRYVAVDSLVKTVEAFISERGKVTTNPTANALVVTDARSVLDRIEPAIAQLDVRRPQVTIAAKIIFIDRTSLQELGFIYDLKDVEGPNGFGGNSLNQVTKVGVDNDGDGIVDEFTNENLVTFAGASVAALANANDRVAAPALQVLTSLALGRFSLISFIEALQQLQLSDVQAQPVVTTMDNREARIQVGEETPIRVIDAGSATSGGVPPRASVTMKETGVILRVKPHVTGDHVLLDLHAERSSIALAPSDIGITFQTQESQTQVLVKDGETVVIGGLTIIEKTESRSGIPFLMDLPGLGRFFRTTKEREVKRDLLIMVTPHIVKDTQG